MKPRQFFFAMIGLLIISILACGGIYYSVKGNLDKNIITITQRNAELETINDKVRILNQTRNTLTELEEISIAQRANTLLPESKSQSAAIQNLFDIFSGVGIPLEGITFDSTEDSPSATSQSEVTDVASVRSLPVELTFNPEMPYPQAKNLLNALRSSSRHVSVTYLELSPALEGSQNIILALSLSIHYEDTAAKAAQQPTEDGTTSSSPGANN